jgi:hypothetical protein
LPRTRGLEPNSTDRGVTLLHRYIIKTWMETRGVLLPTLRQTRVVFMTFFYIVSVLNKPRIVCTGTLFILYA